MCRSPEPPQSKPVRLPSFISVAACSVAVLHAAASADVIADWNEAARDHLAQHAPNLFQNWRGWVMLSVAEFDAVNAIVGGYTPYALNLAAPGASPEAAVAQAAYAVLTNISRASLGSLNATLTASLASVPDGPAKTDGIRVGQLAAEAVMRLRAADAPDLSVPAPSGSTAAGRWRPTPPSFGAAFGTQGRFLTPWTMRSASQFRPGPPPPLSSESYTRDYSEIRTLGSRGNTNRTPAQADSAHLREQGEDYLDDVFARRPLPLLESTRRSALCLMAGMDALIQVFETKYTYNFWRPVTAIRAGASDGNDATEGDLAWTPFLDTHPHPEYPSALVQNSAAMIEILILLHGDEVEFTATSTNPARSRSFRRLSHYVEDGITARVVGGTHFRNSCEVAAEVGRQIARHAFENYLRPVPVLSPGAPRQPAEFQLSLTTGRAVPFVVEASSDLVRWVPWRTNLYGTILQTDTNADAADRRFYRVLLPQP